MYVCSPLLCFFFCAFEHSKLDQKKKRNLPRRTRLLLTEFCAVPNPLGQRGGFFFIRNEKNCCTTSGVSRWPEVESPFGYVSSHTRPTYRLAAPHELPVVQGSRPVGSFNDNDDERTRTGTNKWALSARVRAMLPSLSEHPKKTPFELQSDKKAKQNR